MMRRSFGEMLPEHGRVIRGNKGKGRDEKELHYVLLLVLGGKIRHILKEKANRIRIVRRY